MNKRILTLEDKKYVERDKYVLVLSKREKHPSAERCFGKKENGKLLWSAEGKSAVCRVKALIKVICL
jgi:hypothetical protein